ncbi:DUF6559 family protein [Tuwongella immobilis]|uniref:Uncharacterized protein n=1 Tax=Tuwongella immobilis TaxID=692036 RepID=A0A6C2YN70_9BACT|nr:DUF6559 family protein [Tuwongella immobilis]VIP02731.1 Uncharacterized protein OS=Colwellia psychrerythraea GN=GAB14E_1981 PE=4 SV=1 [Tuwongella immobilis]VTS02283.1 Uncharacterized protein OS=Colwellia psychrerythraea GN=GAB14E_1981 PE=4 SV=1 [Tuwongella immobilis]
MQPKSDGTDDSAEVYALASDSEPESNNTCSRELTKPKRRSIKRYITVLGPALRKKYGRKRWYSLSEVESQAALLSLSDAFLCWAFVLYCEYESFRQHHIDREELCDYFAMRQTVADSLHLGSADFDTNWLLDKLGVADGSGDAVSIAGEIAISSIEYLLEW